MVLQQLENNDGVSSDGCISVIIQNLINESPDVNVDVTDMVNMWLKGQSTKGNQGMLIRFSGSQETDSLHFGHLKFFSRNTHTIFSPRIRSSLG